MPTPAPIVIPTLPKQLTPVEKAPYSLAHEARKQTPMSDQKSAKVLENEKDLASWRKDADV